VGEGGREKFLGGLERRSPSKGGDLGKGLNRVSLRELHPGRRGADVGSCGRGPSRRGVAMMRRIARYRFGRDSPALCASVRIAHRLVRGLPRAPPDASGANGGSSRGNTAREVPARAVLDPMITRSNGYEGWNPRRLVLAVSTVRTFRLRAPDTAARTKFSFAGSASPRSLCSWNASTGEAAVARRLSLRDSLLGDMRCSASACALGEHVGSSCARVLLCAS
jgi:hypothetical protein